MAGLFLMFIMAIALGEMLGGFLAAPHEETGTLSDNNNAIHSRLDDVFDVIAIEAFSDNAFK